VEYRAEDEDYAVSSLLLLLLLLLLLFHLFLKADYFFSVVVDRENILANHG